MKALQNNFTTPEQSKRLLELGVPADSADCIRVIATNMVLFIQEGRNAEYYIDKYNNERNVKAEPCWSVGRLIDISRICTTLPEEEYMSPFWYDTQDIVEWAILVIESGVRTGNMDFSKLEE